MKELLIGILALGSLSSFANSQCRSSVSEAMISKFSARWNYTYQHGIEPIEKLELRNGKELEVWTGYISNADLTNEKAAVVVLDANNCNIESVSLID